MNNLLMTDKDIQINNYEGNLYVNKENLSIKGDNNIYINNPFDILNIYLNENEKSTVNIFLKKVSIINVYSSNNTYLKLNIFSTKNVIINSYVEGNNNYNEINVRCVSFENDIRIKVLAKANDNTKDNIIFENLKGICLNKKIEIIPDLEINTNEIVANHFVTISNINKDYLFYLNSKGINEENAKKLICEGFILSIFDDNTKIKIRKDLYE